MAGYSAYLEKLDKKLHEKNKFTDYLEKAEKATGAPRLYMVLALGGFWALYMVFGCGAELICNAIGFGYPAYASIHAIESHNKDDDTKWLTYWVVFAALILCEFFSNIILSWVPFYWLVKCIFLVWCFAPISNNGAQFIYHKFIRPVFLKNKQDIDATINKAMSGAAEFVLDAGRGAVGKSD